jgi:hypothetical protein
VYTLKDFLDVLDNWVWILGLTNNLKQILIRQEVESWEELSLGLKEVVQVLFDVLELLVQVIENLKEVFDNQRSETVLLLVDSLHLKLEDIVDSGEN